MSLALHAPPLHAQDPPGEVAHSAAQFAHAVVYNLLAAASPNMDMMRRLDALERAFTAWPSLCQLMAELEGVAPRCSAAGYARAMALRDIAERHEAGKQAATETVAAAR